jgi:hypothetical protein
MYGAMGGATPAYAMAGGATPMYGAGAGGRTPSYGAAGGRTPSYGAAGGRTPSYGAAGGRTPTTTAQGGRTPISTSMLGGGGMTPGGGGGGGFSAGLGPGEGRAIQLAAAIAGGLDTSCELAGAWASVNVRIDVILGPHKGRRGVIRSVGSAGTSAQVLFDEMVNNTSVKLSDTIPEKPSGQADTYVRILGGEYVGKIAKVMLREDESTLLCQVGEVDEPESLPINMLVAIKS